ncbi:MAG: glutaredoxin family protein [Anaerolineae bacterium]
MKEFLSQNEIAYEDKDVSADEAALHELIHLGVATTPVTVIDGEVVVGFDRKKLAELLEVG